MEDILSHLRNDHSDFDKGNLIEIIGDKPFDLFEKWYAEAFQTKQPESNAFVLSTIGSEGFPSSRVLYLKELLHQRLVFYTNYKSQKGQELTKNSHASMLFFWPGLERQIRIEGICQKVTKDRSDAYFQSRPRSSQLGAWASKQSEKLKSRRELEERMQEYAQIYTNEVPRPPHWGGYEMIPKRFEFWQGLPSRLHDRIVWELTSNQWEIYRKNP